MEAGSARSAAHLCFTGWARCGCCGKSVLSNCGCGFVAVEHHGSGVNLAPQVFNSHWEFKHFQPWKDGDNPD